MFDLAYTPEQISLRLIAPKRTLADRLLRRPDARNLEQLPPADRDLILAIADLRALGDESPEELHIEADRIRLSHKVAARLDAGAAEKLGLPPLVDLTLRTDAEGTPGSASFRLCCDWYRHGQRQFPRRIGSFLETSDGLRRVPIWMLEAIEAAEGLSAGQNLLEHWSALARFRRAIDPGVSIDATASAARLSMTDFLAGLNVRVADRFSITSNADGDDFEVVPFSDEAVSELVRMGATPSISNSDLQGDELSWFQRRVRERGALPAYRLDRGAFLVVEPSALPALRAMADAQRATPEKRAEFIRNPLRRITEEVEADLRGRGLLDGLTEESQAEAIERAVGPVFVETKEFSERVSGVKPYERSIAQLAGSGTTWLPEGFERRLAEVLDKASVEDLKSGRDQIDAAIVRGEPSVSFGDLALPAKAETLAIFDDCIGARKNDGTNPVAKTAEQAGAKLVIDTKSNFETVTYAPQPASRHAIEVKYPPPVIRTALKDHQLKSLEWQVSAWRAGHHGVLNADEPGLGKTLQTIAFLSWLKLQMESALAQERGPILIVAPTSLLVNWEQEVSTHLHDPGLGHIVRLFGAAISSRKLTGKSGVDIDSGEATLDLGWLLEAIREGRAHRFWILTTYTTLTNYQHSLGRIRFCAAVFDEIQNLKNPESLRALAAFGVNADFRIGLTGTPIENSALDLWAIMDQLSPGALGSRREFRETYETPNRDAMKDLHGLLFASNDKPAYALRRLKEDVARDLPAKSRRLHPRVMPKVQSDVYEVARIKLSQGGPGAALKMLHHIRAVSVHPTLDTELSGTEFINSSARLHSAFEVLKRIAAKNERCLVFIEHIRMQFRFIELARSELGLRKIELINGDTPISKRQEIVNRFQRHLDEDGGFDILVLGPKAAGVGLTLTAATHVIHLSRWWNPAVEEQCNDRCHRIGQKRPVTVHIPMAIHPRYREDSFDCLLQSLMERKRRLARSALWPMGDSEADAAELRRSMKAEMHGEFVNDPVRHAIEQMFRRDQLTPPKIESDGSIQFGP
jgi:superfamily II DNA or RNA helicase